MGDIVVVVPFFVIDVSVVKGTGMVGGVGVIVGKAVLEVARAGSGGGFHFIFGGCLCVFGGEG